MKKEIEIPEGYEIDVLTFKKVGPELPMWFEDLDGNIIDCFWRTFTYVPKKYQVLRKLELLRDEWNEGWVADWIDGDQDKWCITFAQEDDMIHRNIYTRCFLSFKTEELANRFRKQFQDLILEAKELL